MGWTAGQLEGTFSARSAIEFALGEDFYATVLDAALIGSTIYAAFHPLSSETGQPTDEVIALVLLTERRNGELSVKALEESMGPAEDACPARILKLLTPTTSENALRWRARCWDRIHTLEKVQPGARVCFGVEYLTPEGPFREFTCVDRAKGRFRAPNGVTYALRGWRNAIEAVIA